MSSCEPCMFSSKQVSATHICQVCNERYCLTCAENHDTFGALRGHRIVSIETQFGSAEYDSIYEKYEGDKQDSEAQNRDVTCASDEYKEYDYAVLHGDDGASNHFYIDVEDTELSRLISIDNKQCLLMIDPNTMLVSVAHNSVRKIDFNLELVRRYGIVSKLRDMFAFELGRRCQFGEGELRFKCKDCQSLLDVLSNSVKRYKTSASSSDKQK